MRVLFVNRSEADERLGGDTVQMHETARALRRLGIKVDERLGPQDPASLAPYDVVHLFNLQTPAFTAPEAEKVKAAGKKLAVSTIFWDFGAELLVSESRIWGRVASVAGNPVALQLARRRVNSVAAVDRGQMRRILELADVCLPNSQAEVAHLQRILPTITRIQVVPNGIDGKRFDPSRPLPLPTWATERGIPSRGYVLVAARIDHHKNQVPFCRAMQGFDHPIVLCGQTADEALVHECTKAGAIYIGSLSGDDLDAAYRHARVHALPSFRETPGLSSLEAAAMGCAIVSTSAGSARDYFGDDAKYCNPQSADSMRGAVVAAWKSGAPAGFGERVRRDFTWDAAAERTLEAYRSLA